LQRIVENDASLAAGETDADDGSATPPAEA
jgi:hypothetical protein